MRVLIALSGFKGTLAGDEASSVVAEVLERRRPGAEVRVVPVADGGDGTLAIALDHGFRAVEVAGADALGRPTRAVAGRRDGEALLELAAICGIGAVEAEDWSGGDTTSLGVGLACADLLDDGVEAITVSLGGSASTDGGLGLLAGLGGVPRDAEGHPCPPTLAGLERTVLVDREGLHPRAAQVRWRFLVDVDSPLTGPHGAARMFGPQKRLDRAAVDRAEEALRRWGAWVEQACGRPVADRPGAGAAGGILVGAQLVADPAVESGSRFLAALTGLEDAVRSSDLVITGEGSLDEQSLRGKGPGLVIGLARQHGVPFAVVAGRSDLRAADIGARDVVTLVDVVGPSAALDRPADSLRRAAEVLVDRVAPPGSSSGHAADAP